MMIRKVCIIVVVLQFVILGLCFGQIPTSYPYGGVEDCGRGPYGFGPCTIIFSTAFFFDAHFASEAYFIRAQFGCMAVFRGAKFAKTAAFGGAKFASEANFTHAKFGGWANFMGAQFDSQADFMWAKFGSWATFGGAQFASRANFRYAQFDSAANFKEAQFDSAANFNEAEFVSTLDFSGTEFGNAVDFSSTTFQKGVDFRRSKFDSLHTITFDEKTSFPVGELRFYWRQFKGVENFWPWKDDWLRIQLGSPRVVHSNNDSISYKNLLRRSKDSLELNLNFLDSLNVGLNFLDTRKITKARPDSTAKVVIDRLNMAKAWLDSTYDDDARSEAVNKENYERIETFYHQLRDNFIKQGNNTSADAVMYELGWQRQEIIGEFWWTMYGSLFGWGYRSWRFLVWLATPIALLFAYFWHRYFYHLVAPIVSDKLPKQARKVLSRETHLGWKARKYDRRYIADQIGFPTRIWHSTFFSASVLLGIRFKKDWLEAGNNRFVYLVSFEWALGIALYVVFAILVKSNQFAFVKGLLGF